MKQYMLILTIYSVSITNTYIATARHGVRPGHVIIKSPKNDQINTTQTCILVSMRPLRLRSHSLFPKHSYSNIFQSHQVWSIFIKLSKKGCGSTVDGGGGGRVSESWITDGSRRPRSPGILSSDGCSHTVGRTSETRAT